MRFIDGYKNVIATIERSGGNERVGDMWTQTRSFPKTESMDLVIAWARDNGCSGKLILTVDEDIPAVDTNDLPF